MIERMHRLRELKLDGMYRALQALQDMGDSSLATLWPILARLVEVEADYRRQSKATLTRLADCRWVASGQTLLITGPTGAGKSYLASALWAAMPVYRAIKPAIAIVIDYGPNSVRIEIGTGFPFLKSSKIAGEKKPQHL